MLLSRPIAAVDADGVMLDYNHAFGERWMAHFGVTLVPREPRAYHATNYWGVTTPPREDLFWASFDATGWKTMRPLPGAVEACQRLRAAGFEVVCVSSMPAHRAADRLANLQALGFPIARLVATGSAKTEGANPKKEAIEALKPVWFVDDELRKLKDLEGVRLVLVDPGHPDTPNPPAAPRDHLAMVVPSLAAFVDRLLGPREYPDRDLELAL